MSRSEKWGNSVPRAELDARARMSRLRQERLERLLAPHVTVARVRPERRRLRLGRSRAAGPRPIGSGSASGRTRAPLPQQRPAVMPETPRIRRAAG